MCYRAALIVSGGVSAGAGTAALVIGRDFHRDYARLVAGATATPPAAALGFLLCGLALVGVAFWIPKLSSILAMLTLSMALVTGFERLLGVQPNFELLVANSLGHPGGGALSTNTIAALLLAGVALFLRHIAGYLPRRFETIALLGAVILAIGLAACVGYMTQVPVYAWGRGTPMSLLAAIATSVLGWGIITSAWRFSELDRSGTPRWFPEIVFAGAFGIDCATALAYILGDKHGWPASETIALLPMVAVSTMVSILAGRAALRHRRAAEIASNI
ncbi:MAG: hypothetical protein KGN36_02420 [Acidobacteriota bacterium]|nr:hypothetical protein [Acidobacteriota bacterium]